MSQDNPILENHTAIELSKAYRPKMGRSALALTFVGILTFVGFIIGQVINSDSGWVPLAGGIIGLWVGKSIWPTKLKKPNKRNDFLKTETFKIKPINVDIRLGNNEACFFHCPASIVHWGEVSPGFPLLISRRDGWIVVNSGTLYFTNKKLQFIGGEGSVKVSLAQLAHHEFESGIIELYKNSGKPIRIKLDEEDAQCIDMLLQNTV